MVLFILFQNPNVSKNIWKYDPYKDKTTDFIEQLENLGNVFLHTPVFANYLQFDKSNKYDDFDKEYKFNLEDIRLKNYSQYIYEQVKDTKDKFIVVGLEEGCHYANYFANQYHENCSGLFLIGNRRISKENYLKSVERGERMMEKDFGKGIKNILMMLAMITCMTYYPN